MKALGLVGFGQFGKFAARHLKDHFDVTVSDEKDVSESARKMGLKAGPLKQAAQSDVVVLAVPVSKLRSVLKAIAPHLKKGAWVADVGSVKIEPVEWMEKILPKTVNVIGTHPIFGPQSGRNGIQGLPIIVCPVRGDSAKVTAFLEGTLKLHVVQSTPEKHDEDMAYSQALAHFVGQALKEMDLPDVKEKAATYEALLAIRDLVKYDSPELFETIQKENPHAETVRQRFMDQLEEIHKRLRKA
ncbi:prephenate dehydrogenase/arogenate dehydrogenase family protein [Candidatus Micrarchaeota archaeon]|nr:prephenate dehydrogenase/arogenate dehydrogenase family protein [Candidatus Micrarchaeota archaeon]